MLKWNGGNLVRGGVHMRRQMQNMAMSGLFGIASDVSESEKESLIRRQIEARRGAADTGGTPSLENNFANMHAEDKTPGLFYKYENRVNDTYAIPSSDKQRVPASDLLIGRITRANPPEFYVDKGLIWKRDG